MNFQYELFLLDNVPVLVCVFIDSICFCQNATTCPVGRQPFTEILVHATRKGPVLKRVSTKEYLFPIRTYVTKSLKSLNNLYTIMIFFDTNILTINNKLKETACDLEILRCPSSLVILLVNSGTSTLPIFARPLQSYSHSGFCSPTL